MVKDRITDGYRIAQLLADELEGRTDGDLERFAVTNANRDVEPTEAGAHAYDVQRDGVDVASVLVHPAGLSLEFIRGTEAILEAAATHELQAETDSESESDDEGPAVTVRLESGAAVKRAATLVKSVSQALEETR